MTLTVKTRSQCYILDEPQRNANINQKYTEGGKLTQEGRLREQRDAKL
jgi:hypothetical protein